MSQRVAKPALDTQRIVSVHTESSGDVGELWDGTPHWCAETETAIKAALRRAIDAGWGSLQKFCETEDLALSDVSKPLNGTEGRHVALWLIIRVCKRRSAAMVITEALNVAMGCEPPVTRRAYTEAEELAAYRAEVNCAGPIGDDMAARVAKRLGVRSVRR